MRARARTYLAEQICDLLRVDELLGLQGLRLDLVLLLGETLDVGLDVMQVGVHM